MMECSIKGITVIFILIMWTQETYGIIGYDCGSAAANLTTLSLINIEECDVDNDGACTGSAYSDPYGN